MGKDGVRTVQCRPRNAARRVACRYVQVLIPEILRSFINPHPIRWIWRFVRMPEANSYSGSTFESMVLPERIARSGLPNAGETSYTKGWENYQVCTSTDRENWFRVPRTTFENGVLEFHHTPEADLQWYAYFAPYSYERHLDLLSWAQEGEGVRVDSLGLTLDGRDMHRIEVGEGPLPFG